MTNFLNKFQVHLIKLISSKVLKNKAIKQTAQKKKI